MLHLQHTGRRQVFFLQPCIMPGVENAQGVTEVADTSPDRGREKRGGVMSYRGTEYTLGVRGGRECRTD